jgi:hypothetical protein
MGDGFGDARALMAETAIQIAEVTALYELALQAGQLDPRLIPRVKNVLENQRSVLDYAAHELVRRFGTPKGKIYFPVAEDAAAFHKQIPQKLPGVLDRRPDIIDFLRGRQPFSGAPWLRDLVTYVNPMKHSGLIPQTRIETRRHTVTTSSGTASWNPGAVRFGSGVRIGGFPVDPATQAPIGTPVQVTVLVGWNFEGTDRNVLATLRLIQTGLEGLLPDLEFLASTD